MGANYAADLAAHTDLRTGIALNLSVNHYPPLPVDYVDVVVEAVWAAQDGEPDAIIHLPSDLNPLPRTAWRTDDGWAVDAATLLNVTHSWDFVTGEDA